MGKPQYVIYSSFPVVEMFKGKYSGQNLKIPVANGTMPINPHQLSKITPIIAIINPAIIRNNLSIDPTLPFTFFCFKFEMKQLDGMLCSKLE